MSQPEWKCIAQLGDASPVEYGGYWVFVDETGVYSPEAEHLYSPEEEDDEYVAHRFSLDQCTFKNGVLSDNPFHPEHCAWWATTPEKMKERPQDGKGLTDIASYCGIDEEELVRMFCSEDPTERAHAYRVVGEYHGFENLDGYPLRMTQVEAEARYEDARFQK